MPLKWLAALLILDELWMANCPMKAWH